MAVLLILTALIVVLALVGTARSKADKVRRAKMTPVDRWTRLLTQGHPPLCKAQKMMRHLPSPPRCKLCFNPFGGIPGKMMRLVGFKPSRKNPNFCTRCCDMLPPGGAEVEIGVLFADVRGSTRLGEGTSPSEFAMLLNRFYVTATDVMVRHDAIVDKLIGDEIMALFVPGFAGPEYRRKAAEAAAALLRAVGYGSDGEGPWLEIGVGVNAGIAYVGNVGSTGVMDFTALGDTVNVAARLQGVATSGQMILSADVHAASADLFPTGEPRTVSVDGREKPVSVVAAHV